MGLIGFTCLVYGVVYLPIFIVAIVYNIAPFITAILGYLINNEAITRFNILCIFGCFSGVLLLSLTKSDDKDEIDDDLKN